MSNQQPPTSNHRSVTGLVTKLVGDGATYGFINDEIFFQQTNVTGGPASVGDQIYAECEYSAHLPIKWNATTVRIVKKVSGSPQDPSAVSMNQPPPPHPQQPFNQPQVQVAGTYQQHRQQRMQRQVNDIEKVQDPNVSRQDPSRLPDQPVNQGEFFNANDPRSAFNQQNRAQQLHNDNILPFQEQPMGPPKFTYTSQLGSAFIQNQFATPPPFIAQAQATPLLPQTQHLTPQQHQNQGNQRQNKAGGRFNNQSEKNDSRQNKRGNRNDRDRSRDRDSHNNDRSQDDKRDRLTGRSNKRDDVPVRPSPPPHSSARSSTSVSSDKGARSRRHYDAQVVPRTRILTNMNAYNMKQRCPSSVHVPSDLMGVIVNQYYRLDIKNTPKPIQFTIEKPQVTAERSNTEGVKIESTREGDEKISDGATEKTNDEGSIANPDNEGKSDTAELKPIDRITPPASKSDSKLNHKYGVKVILLSLPDFNSIYREVYGENYDSYTSEGKPSKSLGDIISLLCNKASNNGYSLIGGKFDPVLDGFVEGSSNEFERHGRQPDLIATCKRVVQDQTGLDLGPCESWALLSTFMYNNRSDYLSSKASVEYSFIYVPQIWTMTNENATVKNIINNQELGTITDERIESKEAVNIVQGSDSAQTEFVESGVQESNKMSAIESDNPDKNATLNIENLPDLKVADLKVELDKRDIKYKPGAKKAELAALLRDFLERASNEEETAPSVPDQASGELDAQEAGSPSEPTDANPLNDASFQNETSVGPEKSDGVDIDQEPTTKDQSVKRKLIDDDQSQEGSKKTRTEESTSKLELASIIENSFSVRSKGELELTLISLNEATLAARHDQFELSVASNILKESLTQHLSEYILTALVEDSRQRTSPASGGSNSSSQDSDSNNNKSSFKNPTIETKVNTKELSVDRYVNLAFSYIDSSHMGYVYFDDLHKLFNNTGISISKRALIALVGEGERYYYRTLPDLSPKLSPTYVYKLPEQFNRLPGSSCVQNDESEVGASVCSSRMVEHEGITYDVDKLVRQVKDAETMRVNLYDRFNYAIANSDKQAEAIHVLEVNQKSLTKATKAQNDEICELKRERDSLKKKLDVFRKGIRGAVSSLSDLVKEENKQ